LFVSVARAVIFCPIRAELVLEFSPAFGVDHGDRKGARFKEITTGSAATESKPIPLNGAAECGLCSMESDM